MLSRVRVWHILIAQLLTGAVAIGILALLIHFPDVAHRPNSRPDGAALVLFVLMSAALLGFGLLYDRTSARLAVGIIITLSLWLVAVYGFAFVWINTFGT